MLLNFVDLSTIFCPSLSRETYFHLLVFLDPMEFAFLTYFSISSESQGKSKFNIFQEAPFYTLASSVNLVLRAVPIKAGQCLCRAFRLFY